VSARPRILRRVPLSPAELPRRQHLRLRSYDYSQPGAYFVTIVTESRQCLFGTISYGELHLNPAGTSVNEWWLRLPDKFPHVALLSHVVMPNHVHGLVQLTGHPQPLATSLPDVMQWFKTMTTNAYAAGVRTHGWAPFPGRLWQRGYYDHIVRHEEDLASIAEYIEANPANWAEDHENPEAVPGRSRSGGHAGPPLPLMDSRRPSG
jgi:putative transposase